MRRRDVLAGLLSTATTSALRAAEPGKVYRLAVSTPFTMDNFSSLFSLLRQRGYREGENLMVYRYAAGLEPERYAELARSIVGQHPDVIALAFDNQLISQVAKETKTIPIVALIPSIDGGLVRNMSRPEGNITGVTMDAGIEMQGKHLEIIQQAAPAASRIAYLCNRDDWGGAWGKAVLEAGRRSNVEILGIPLEQSADAESFRQAFELMNQRSADALMFSGLAPNLNHRTLIVGLALQHRLPSIGWHLDVVRKGAGFLAYAPDYRELPDHWADQIDRVFRGTRVSEIPVHQPTKFLFAINLRTAKALGLDLPALLIASADEVIE